MKYEIKVILIHLVISLVLSLLSLFGLFFNNWELFVSFIIATFFSVIYFILLLASGSFIEPEISDGKTGIFLLFTLLRFIVALIGILLPTLIIYLTNNDGNKLRFLNVLGATVPFLLVNIVLIVVKKKED